MEANNILEVSFVSDGKDTFRGKIITKYAEDAIITIEMEKVKIDGIDLVRTELPQVGNKFMFCYPSGYTDEVKLYAESIGKESITFSEFIDYLKEKNEFFSETIKKLRLEKSNIIKESQKQNRKYKKIINSLQKTIGRLLDIDKQ